MRKWTILFLAIVMFGCSKPGKDTTSDSNKPAQSSLAKDAIEGLTGKTAVMAGEKAKDKIRTISASENKNLNEVLDDK